MQASLTCTSVCALHTSMISVGGVLFEARAPMHYAFGLRTGEISSPCFCFLARGSNECASLPHLLQRKVWLHWQIGELYLSQAKPLPSDHHFSVLLVLLILLVLFSFAISIWKMSLPVEPYSTTDLYVCFFRELSTHSTGCLWYNHGYCYFFMRFALLRSLDHSRAILPWWLFDDVRFCILPSLCSIY